MGIQGAASRDGTARYAARFAGAAAGHFRSLNELTVSTIGLGTYLGNDDDATDAAYESSIRRAVELGLNVVDSAINYRCQRSERAVGPALGELISKGSLARDEIVVATKGGYLPFDGGRPDDVRAYIRDTFIEPGILRPADVVAGCHSIAPAYLKDQIERSRRNLGLDTIDIYYLHNPEQQLDEVDRPEFHRRMRAAFELLESEVELGAIARYGAATWGGFRQDRGTKGYLGLEDLEGLAREVGGADHHFRVIQLPYNLAMTEAHALWNQPLRGATSSLLAAAAHLGIGVMASASVYQGHLTRELPPELGEVLPGPRTDAQRALQFVRSTPGVAVALVGMRRVAHVEENLVLAGIEPADPAFLEQLFQPPGESP